VITRTVAETVQVQAEQNITQLPAAVLAEEVFAKPDVITRQAPVTQQSLTEQAVTDLTVPELVSAHLHVASELISREAAEPQQEALHFHLPEKIKESRATATVFPVETVQTEYTQSEYGVSELVTEDKTKLSKAKTNILTKDVAVTEMPVSQESAVEFIPTRMKQGESRATPKVVSREVAVKQVSYTEENAELLMAVSKETDSKAKLVITEGREAPLIEETLPSLTLQSWGEGVPGVQKVAVLGQEQAHAVVDVAQSTHVVIEGTLVTQLKHHTADVTFQLGEGITITSEETTLQLLDAKSPMEVASIAMSDSDKGVAVQEEVNTSLMIEGEFTSTQTDVRAATSSVSRPISSAQVCEVSVHEREDTLLPLPKEQARLLAAAEETSGVVFTDTEHIDDRRTPAQDRITGTPHEKCRTHDTTADSKQKTQQFGTDEDMTAMIQQSTHTTTLRHEHQHITSTEVKPEPSSQHMQHITTVLSPHETVDISEILAELAPQTTHTTATQSFEQMPAVVVSETTTEIREGEYVTGVVQRATATEMVEDTTVQFQTVTTTPGGQVIEKTVRRRVVKGSKKTILQPDEEEEGGVSIEEVDDGGIPEVEEMPPVIAEELPEKIEETEQSEKAVTKKPKEKPAKQKSKAIEEGIEKPKPQLMKLEKVEVKPTKLKVVDVSNIEELPLFAQIKLKKPKLMEKKEIKSLELPKILLKSHIKHIPYPPEELKPVITILNVKLEHGILSRNTQEALKLLKKKTRKIKLSGKEETQLEEPWFEKEETEKPTTEEEEVKLSWEKLPKKPEKEEDEARKLVIGKGKLPTEEQPEEKVTLKKIPEKAKEPEDEKQLKPKKPEPEVVKSKQEKQDVPLQLQPIEDRDFEREEPEITYPVPEETEKLEEEMPETDKMKKPKPKKSKKEPEIIQVPLEKGKPKEPQPEEDEDISLRKKMGEPKPEKPEDITLKPFTKEKSPEEEDKKRVTHWEAKTYRYNRGRNNPAGIW